MREDDPRYPEYRIWAHIVQRCTNPKDRDYHNYGGRGIKMCDRWRYSFENFWSDMGPRPSKRMTIERVDNDGDYEPGNCEWRTREQQIRNTRRNRWLTHAGETLCVADWAKKLGFHVMTLHGRLNRGWSVERTLTEKPIQLRTYRKRAK